MYDVAPGSKGTKRARRSDGESEAGRVGTRDERTPTAFSASPGISPGTGTPDWPRVSLGDASSDAAVALRLG
jgi:hypothetical protein